MTQAESLANTYREHTEIKEKPTRPYDSAPIFDLVYSAAEEACTDKQTDMNNDRALTMFEFKDGSMLLITTGTNLTAEVKAL